MPSGLTSVTVRLAGSTAVTFAVLVIALTSMAPFASALVVALAPGSSAYPATASISAGIVAISRRKNDRASDQIRFWRVRKLFLGRRPFRDGEVTGRGDELGDLLIRDYGFVHPKSVHANAVNRLGIIRRHRHRAIE